MYHGSTLSTGWTPSLGRQAKLDRWDATPGPSMSRSSFVSAWKECSVVPTEVLHGGLKILQFGLSELANRIHQRIPKVFSLFFFVKIESGEQNLVSCAALILGLRRT